MCVPLDMCTELIETYEWIGGEIGGSQVSVYTTVSLPKT